MFWLWLFIYIRPQLMSDKVGARLEDIQRTFVIWCEEHETLTSFWRGTIGSPGRGEFLCIFLKLVGFFGDTGSRELSIITGVTATFLLLVIQTKPDVQHFINWKAFSLYLRIYLKKLHYGEETVVFITCLHCKHW